MKTQVGIIGAGPAGLLLARILQYHGIETVILERRSRAYVLSRIRAGVLEQGTVDTLNAYGVGERLAVEGIRMETMQLRWKGEPHVISMTDEAGRRLTTYGQSKVVGDLIELRETDGLPILFDAPVDRIEDIEGRPVLHFSQDGEVRQLDCAYIGGCDGYRGICRSAIPGADERSFLREFPFSWLGILAEAAPHPEVRGFAHSTRGLAVASARSRTIGRLYLQVPPETDVAAMSDDEIWDELDRRLDDGGDHRLNRGPIIERSLARLRGFVCETMQHGRLCIAGDAAHIVPPSGAKGMNLAVGDARVMAEAFRAALKDGDTTVLENYTQICLRRIWPTVHWSCSMAEAFHIFPGQSDFETEMQYQTLNHWAHTELGTKRFRLAMMGLPYEI